MEEQMLQMMQMLAEKQMGKIGNREDPPSSCSHMGQKFDPRK